jgi:hypothetical protein
MVYIVVSRIVVGSFTIGGELLCENYSLRVAGFGVIPLQADCICYVCI